MFLPNWVVSLGFPIFIAFSLCAVALLEILQDQTCYTFVVLKLGNLGFLGPTDRTHRRFGREIVQWDKELKLCLWRITGIQTFLVTRRTF